MNNDIIEANSLLAKFMGAEWRMDDYGDFGFFYPEGQFPSDRKLPGYALDALKYHSSWDWLMPVVEKINRLELKGLSGNFKVTCEICPGHTSFGRTNWSIGEGCTLVNACEGKSMIENTYLACLYFIKWYNSQPSKQPLP